MWKCPMCETLNEGANCMVCGEAKPTVSEAPVAPTYMKAEPTRSTLKSTFASSKTTGVGHTPYRPVHSEPLTPPPPVTPVPPPEKKGGAGKVITILIILLILVKLIVSMMDTGYDESEYSNEQTSGYYDSHPQYYGE